MIVQEKNAEYEEIFEKIRQNLRDDERFKDSMKFIRKLTKNYSETIGLSETEILQAMENKRTYWSANYYQEANFPLLEAKNVYVFETIDDFYIKFPSKKYYCPLCKKVSTDPYNCNSGEKVLRLNSDETGKVQKCNWSVGGLFRDLGTGIFIIVKDKFLGHPIPELIMRPIELGKIEEKKA